jgi:hypothetical protein
VLEQELVDLTEYFRVGGQTPNVRSRQGWSLVAAVWDSKGQRLLGCLRMESAGGGDDNDVVTELEDAPFAQ